MHTLFVSFHDNTSSPHSGATEAAAIEDAALSIGLSGFDAIETAALLELDERGIVVTGSGKDAKQELLEAMEAIDAAEEQEREEQERHERLERMALA